MPTYRSLVVRITDRDDAPFEEYSISTNSRQNLATCYIQSHTDMSFQIAISPTTLPFPEFSNSEMTPHLPDFSDMSLTEIEHYYAQVEHWLYPMGPQHIGDKVLTKHLRVLAGRDVNRHQMSLEDRLFDTARWSGDQAQVARALDCLRRFATTAYVGPQSEGVPYQLLATLRLDGKKKYEKQSIVHLDQWAPASHSANGETKMSERLVQGSDGVLRKCGWFFRETNGIEKTFDSLQISPGDGQEDAVPVGDEHDLSTAFADLGADNLAEAQDKLPHGKIEITLERVTIAKERKQAVWQPHEEQDQDIEMGTEGKEGVPHTTARDEGIVQDRFIETIRYERLDPEDKPFATFAFLYRNEETLRKMGMLEALPTGRKQKRKDVFSTITPLSVSAAASGAAEAPSVAPLRKRLAEMELDEEKGLAKKGRDEDGGDDAA